MMYDVFVYDISSNAVFIFFQLQLTMSRKMTCVSLLDIQSHLQLKEATHIFQFV